MLLYYIRHANPIYDPDSITPEGELQAAALAKRLAVYGVDRIFSSSSNRAVMTAAPTATLLGKDITKLDFCTESRAWATYAKEDVDGTKHFAFQNTRLLTAFADPAVYALGEAWYTHPAFAKDGFAEGVQSLHRDTDAFLRTLGYDHDRENRRYRVVTPNSERVALFAHQGFGMAFLSSLLDIPYPVFASHFDLRTTGLTVIDFKEYDGFAIPKLLTLSNDAHLYSEGLSTQYNGDKIF